MKRDPSQSDRSIARKTNVTAPTVAAVRKEAEEGVDGVKVLHQTTRIGANGVAQPATKAARA